MRDTDPLQNPEPPASTRDPLAGTAYRFLGALGKGGMGEVVLAEHVLLGKRVVVKLLHARFSGDPRFADRLLVEAKSLARVEHPNVLVVSDVGRTPSGRPYLVTEHLQGRTLGDELRARGPLPVSEALGIARQVLAGLAAAHAQGIIHRDVKLDNVFLCEGARPGSPLVKVIDFGVAKVLPREGGATRRLGPLYPTEEGVLVGSPRYVAPEQVRGGTIDARTDVYATGLLLYTMLAGRGPFAHLTEVMDLLDAHLNEIPAPPSQHAPQPIVPELERAVLRALAKAPPDRFQSAALFADELGRIAAMLGDMTLPFVRPARELASSANHTGETWRLPPPAALLAPARPKPTSVGIFAALTVGSALIVSAVIVVVVRLLGGR